MGTAMCTCSFEEPSMSPRRTRKSSTSVNVSTQTTGSENDNSYSQKILRASGKRSHSPNTTPLLHNAQSTTSLLVGDSESAASVGQSRISVEILVSRTSAQANRTASSPTPGGTINPLAPQAARLHPVLGPRQQQQSVFELLRLPSDDSDVVLPEEPADIAAPFTPLQMPPLILSMNAAATN
jgi:hypothetical protein